MFDPTAALKVLASGSTAAAMHSYVAPLVQIICILASLICVFFLINGGIQYMTSGGHPEKLASAKQIIKNALVGLVIVLAAGTITTIFSGSYHQATGSLAQNLPSLNAIQPTTGSDPLVDVILKAVTGILDSIIQSVALPFISALSYFTSGTPLISENASVFNLWLAVVGMTDVLFVLVVALLGLHVMSYSTFGLDEMEFKHLLPQMGLAFLLINSSAFLIDALIGLSNAMINAIHSGFGQITVWSALSNVTKQSSGLGIAALLIMVVFLIFSIALLVYYIGRIVTIYIGAVLAPLILLVWLLPSFRDFAASAAKTYVSNVFVLFVHVVILELAASLFAGIATSGSAQVTDPIMAMIVGLAVLIALLKTQGVMMQLSYASIGPRAARKLGGQLVNSVSYFTGHGNGATRLSRNFVNNPKSEGGSRGSASRTIATTNRSSNLNHLSVPTTTNSDRGKTKPGDSAINAPGPLHNNKLVVASPQTTASKPTASTSMNKAKDNK